MYGETAQYPKFSGNMKQVSVSAEFEERKVLVQWVISVVTDCAISLELIRADIKG